MLYLMRQISGNKHPSPIIQQLVKRKKGVTCRFNVLWMPSDETGLVHSEENMDEVNAKQSKKQKTDW